MSRFLLSVTGFALLVGAAHYGLFMLFDQPFGIAEFLLYPYMLLISITFEALLMRNQSPGAFVNTFMGLSGGKLMFSLFILIIYGLKRPDALKEFALSFLLVYFAFTAFEIVRLYRHLKN